MGKILFGDNITDMRGSRGGATYGKGKYGAVSHNKQSANYKHSNAQQKVISNFTTIAPIWRTLTADQRNQWRAFTNSHPVTDRFGKQQILSAYAMFMRCNRNRTTMNRTILTSPGLVIQPPTILSISLTASFGIDAMICSRTLLDTTNNNLYIAFWYATPQVSAGVSHFNNKLYFMAFASGATQNTNIGAAYVARFGALRRFMRIGIRYTLVDQSTGFDVSFYQSSTIVQ